LIIRNLHCFCFRFFQVILGRFRSLMDTIWTPESIAFYFLTPMNPLRCPACGGQMSVISFIEETKTIDRIIRHLKLSFQDERPPPTHVVHQELLMVAEEMGEYCERSDANPKTKFLSNMLKGLKERGVVYEEKAEKLFK